jgi:hypothetical protein
VKLPEVARPPLEPHLPGIRILQPMRFLEHHAFGQVFADQRATRHMDHRRPNAIPQQVQRRHDTGTRFVGARDERFQPARLDGDIVVQEYDVFRRDAADDAVARLLWPERLVEAHHVEVPFGGPRVEDVAQPARGRAIEIHESVGRRRVGDDAVDDALGERVPLAGRHHEGYAGFARVGHRGAGAVWKKYATWNRPPIFAHAAHRAKRGHFPRAGWTLRDVRATIV